MQGAVEAQEGGLVLNGRGGWGLGRLRMSDLVSVPPRQRIISSHPGIRAPVQ